MDKRFPERTRELAWEKAENNYLLVDHENNKSIALDTVSFLVWAQCDGKTDIDKITDIFAMGGNKDVTKAAVNGVLEKLEQNGLIRWA